MAVLPIDRVQAVQADGLPRVVIADDESAHVLYLDGTAVRSMPASDWPEALPIEPTDAEIDMARQALAEARQAEQDRYAAAVRRLTKGRARLRQIAQQADALSTTSAALTVAQTRQLAAAIRDLTRTILDTELVLARQADDGQD